MENTKLSQWYFHPSTIPSYAFMGFYHLQGSRKKIDHEFIDEEKLDNCFGV